MFACRFFVNWVVFIGKMRRTVNSFIKSQTVSKVCIHTEMDEIQCFNRLPKSFKN